MYRLALFRTSLAIQVLALLAVGAIAFGSVANAAPPAQSADEGQKLFSEKCVACHTIGKGPLAGPDLQGVTTQRDPAWLTKWLSAPDQMLAAKDPTAVQLLAEFNNIPMPNLGLTDAQVASLIAFLGANQAGASTAPAVPQLPPGDTATGRALFTGAHRFANGGPPCMGCHSAGAIGALGGGALGPDLTAAYTKYGGDAGTTAFLGGVPTPIMNAVWSNNPLTPQEQADLVAFLGQVSISERPSDMVRQLAIIVAIVAIVLLAIVQLYWRKRLVAVRRPLVQRARLPKT